MKNLKLSLVALLMLAGISTLDAKSYASYVSGSAAYKQKAAQKSSGSNTGVVAPSQSTRKKSDLDAALKLKMHGARIVAPSQSDTQVDTIQPLTASEAREVGQYYQTLLKGHKAFLKGIPPIVFPKFTLDQIKGIPANRLRKLKKKQLKSLSTAQVQVLSKAQLKKLKPKKLDVIKGKLSAAQKAAL